MAEAGEGKSFNTVDNKDQLMLVEIKDGKFGGYKQELLHDSLTAFEMKFFQCTGCNGLSREACSVGEDQNILCATCVPEGSEHIVMKIARESVPIIPSKCPLNTRGCIWKDLIGNVSEHLDECEYFVVSCPNSCQMILQRLELEQHLKSDCTHRNVTCEHCSGTVLFKDLTKHYEDCLEFPLVCKNECGGTFKRKELQNHINTECPNTVINCGYKLFGCSAEMKRCELPDHNNNNILTHLNATKEYVSNETVRVEEHKILKEQLDTLTKSHETLKTEFEAFKKEIQDKKT